VILLPLPPDCPFLFALYYSLQKKLLKAFKEIIFRICDLDAAGSAVCILFLLIIDQLDFALTAKPLFVRIVHAVVAVPIFTDPTVFADQVCAVMATAVVAMPTEFQNRLAAEISALHTLFFCPLQERVLPIINIHQGVRLIVKIIIDLCIFIVDHISDALDPIMVRNHPSWDFLCTFFALHQNLLTILYMVRVIFTFELHMTASALIGS
jgi:hypothetical protein